MTDHISRRTLIEHIDALAKKEYSSFELTSALLEQIEHRDRDIGAFITLDSEGALKAARESDSRRAKGERLSPLDGIPYAAKDNISVKGLSTTCASNMLRSYTAPYSATVAELLSRAGAILLGKTNMDEFAMGVSTETSCFGVTKNPLDLSRVAGGSSGGSTAAVAAYGLPFALGSDTGGSVRQPAAFCGAVGMRPTYGTVSRYGLISFAPSMDIIGAITKNVADNAYVTSAILSADSRDMTSVKHPLCDLSADIGKDIRGMKIALIGDLPDRAAADSVCHAISHTAAILVELGASIEEISLPHAASAYASYYTIGCAEASSNLARFDGVRYGHRTDSYSNLDSLYRRSRSEGFGDEVKRRILFGTMALSAEYCKDFYESAVKMRAVISHELCNALDSYDAVLLPTAPTEAYGIGKSTLLRFEAGIDDIYCALASLAGLPAISLPYRSKGELPVGIQLIGKAFDESAIYRIAYAIEQALGGESRE